MIVSLTRDEFKSLIREAVDEAGAWDMSGIFSRAGLMTEPVVHGLQ